MSEFINDNCLNLRIKYLFTERMGGVWGEEPEEENQGTVCIRAADFNTDKLSHCKTNLTRRSYKTEELKSRQLKKGDLIIEKSGGGENLWESARKQAIEEGVENLEELFRTMAKRGSQNNLSFFAFTATPKHRTLAIFGRNLASFDKYTMRQAIEEKFIMDVLKNYTTYKAYYKLLKSCENDPKVERKQAAKALARFLKLHPHNISQKTEVMIEHFNSFTRHKIGGRAKAMVVTGSRLEAVRYKQSFDRYIESKNYPIKTLVAFSGIVQDDKLKSVTYTEEQMNSGVREKELPDVFASPVYQVLLVAENTRRVSTSRYCIRCMLIKNSAVCRLSRRFPD